MLRFAANLTYLFTEYPFLDRFQAAADAGFKGVEFFFPYDHPAEVICQKLNDAGLELVLFNLPPGDWDVGERGLAAMPGRQTEFLNGLKQALTYAAILDCKRLHMLAGVLTPGVNIMDMRKAFRANLAKACELASDHDVTLLIEPINSRDVPGYFLTHTGQAKAEIDHLGANNLGLQLDFYHRQIMEGDLTRCLQTYLSITRHIQISNAPGRTEPSKGEIAYHHLFEMIKQPNYAGWVGCEYRPSTERTIDSLGWMDGYLP